MHCWLLLAKLLCFNGFHALCLQSSFHIYLGTPHFHPQFVETFVCPTWIASVKELQPQPCQQYCCHTPDLDDQTNLLEQTKHYLQCDTILVVSRNHKNSIGKMSLLPIRTANARYTVPLYTLFRSKDSTASQTYIGTLFMSLGNMKRNLHITHCPSHI